jgi:para-nitrobenzyl esterase
MPVEPWKGVRDATAFGAICAQNPYFVPNAAEIGKEDCLFLNVWTPQWPTQSSKPVIVWIPGERNFGSGNEGTSEGENLTRRGVVVVTVNYRLGLFGFFAHPALTRESAHHASGNQGILDQIAALQWVGNNIANFEGDPRNVTVFGESSGSVDASALMTSSLSKGLFQGVMGGSGTVLGLGPPLSLKQAENEGEAFTGRLRPGSSSLKDWRTVSAAEILKLEPPFLKSPPTALGLVVDSYVFRKPSAQTFSEGQEHRVPMLIGNTARDKIPGNPPLADLEKVIRDQYGPLAERALALYTGVPDTLYGTPAAQWAGDTSFRCTAVAQLLWHVAAGNPAYEYRFDRAAPGRELVEARHATDMPYVFGTFEFVVSLPGQTVAFNDVDRTISSVMQQYWTNFAKTGDPNDSKLPAWRKFDSASRAHMEFTDAGPVSNEGLRRSYCDLFIENTKRIGQQ